MKRKIVHLMEVLAYYLGVDALFYGLNRRAKRTLCFHNVLPDGMRIEGEAGSFDEDESHFRFIVREVAKRFAFSTDLSDPKTATITFDDGYLNQYEIAAKVLKEEGDIPAILFVAGDNLNNADPSKCLVTDALTHWVSLVPSEKVNSPSLESKSKSGMLNLLSSTSTFDFDLSADRMRYWRDIIRPRYAEDGDHRGKKVLTEYDAMYPMSNVMTQLSPEYRRLRLTGVTSEQVADLRSRGWKVGWHTQTHFPLMQLSSDDQRKELTSGDLFKGEVMAYPYGCPGSIDENTAKYAEEVGLPCACAACNDVPNWTGKYLLPRMYIGGDKYAIHFELSGAKFFMKHRRLLPFFDFDL